MATTHTTIIDLSQLSLAQQPTGAEVVLASNGTYLVASSAGSVYQSENSGQNLVLPGAFFNISGVYTNSNLIVGHIYRWIRGTNDQETASNGTQTVVNEMPTGGSVFFEAITTTINFFSVTPFSSVDLSLYDVTNVGAGVTPSVFLYCNSRIVAYGVSGTDTTRSLALAKWTDWGNTAYDQDVDPAPINTLVSNGTLTVPCRGNNGLIEFGDSGTLLPGNYRLIVESGNIGQPDPDFNGFVVEIALDAVVLEQTLLKGQSGFNVRGFDQFDFVVTSPMVGNFILSFLWTNAYSNSAMGVERQLAVYSYSLRRMATELFRVDLSTSGTQPVIAQLNPFDYASGTTPGGWLVSINSYGTLAAFAHESQVYSANDTVISSTPLSDVLTGVTAEKTEDIILPATEVVIADGGSFIYPPLGALSPSFGTTTYQVGQSVAISIPQPSGTAIYSYVWKFWDGTTQATTGTSVVKEVNTGGIPSNGSLAFSVTPVAVDGQAETVYGAIMANNIPVIVPAPEISNNDAYVPFESQLSLYSFDFENNTPLTFTWVNAETLAVLSAGGTALGTMVVSGTWTGNGTTIVNNYTAYGNAYDALVTTGQTVRCYVVDSNEGTNSIDFPLRGYLSPPPASGIAASANFAFADSSALPLARVGAGQQFIFEVDARDLTGKTLSFQWNFAGSNNWTVPSYGNGTTSVQPDGSYQSLYEKDLSGEIVSTGTSKVATAACIVTNGNSSSEVDISVVLLKNNPPSSVTVVVRNNETQVIFPNLSTIPVDSVIQLEATAVDADDDLVTYEWTVSLTGTPDEIGTAFPLSYDVRGGKVIVNTTGGTAGLQITGNVVATDRAGGTFTLGLPVMTTA